MIGSKLRSFGKLGKEAAQHSGAQSTALAGGRPVASPQQHYTALADYIGAGSQDLLVGARRKVDKDPDHRGDAILKALEPAFQRKKSGQINDEEYNRIKEVAVREAMALAGQSETPADASPAQG